MKIELQCLCCHVGHIVTRSALQKCELNYNSWPQFVSAIQTQLGNLNCLGCETFTGEAVLTCIADSKFVLIEFSPELMNVNIDELMEKFCCWKTWTLNCLQKEEWLLKWWII